MILSYSDLRGILRYGDRVREVKRYPDGSYEIESDTNEKIITGVREDSFDIEGCSRSFDTESYLDIDLDLTRVAVVAHEGGRLYQMR